MKKNENVLLDEVKNKEKNTDIIISTTMLLGSIGFLTVGISSYLKYDIIGFLNAKEILFFPQGLTMCFYGTLGIIISVYQVWNNNVIKKIKNVIHGRKIW